VDFNSDLLPLTLNFVETLAMASLEQPETIPTSNIDEDTDMSGELPENTECEASVGAWLCVLASALFLASSFGKSQQIYNPRDILIQFKDSYNASGSYNPTFPSTNSQLIQPETSAGLREYTPSSRSSVGYKQGH
jgi:hypothetical protein